MREFLTLVVFMVGISAPAEVASTLPRSTFRDPLGAQAKCVPKFQGDVAAVLKQHGVSTKDVPSSFVNHIAGILQLTSDLYGRTFPYYRGAQVHYVKGMNIIARQTRGPIELSAEGLGNRAVYVHEFGHVVGNSKRRDGLTWYQAYGRKVPFPCHFSEYSQVSYGYGPRNEEFAEVFAAYLLVPHMLLEGGPSCRQAYDFIRGEMLRAKDHRCPQNF